MNTLNELFLKGRITKEEYTKIESVLKEIK